MAATKSNPTPATGPTPARRDGGTVLHWAGASDTGRLRGSNEDAWGAFAVGPDLHPLTAPVVPAPGRGALFVLSDGMGGARAGEEASRICVDELGRALAPRSDAADRLGAMRESFQVVHARLLEAARANPAWLGMGATLSALWLPGDTSAVFGHVGDSRIYARGAAGWRRLTDDHSLGEGLVRRGEMTPAAAARFRFRSLLEQVMGGDGRPIEPQVAVIELADVRAFALCCDGLYRPLEENLAGRLTAAVDAADLALGAGELVAAANAAGGPDNITVVLVRPAAA